MHSRIFGAGLLVCLAAACCVGQDPTKVEPKHYKRDFENDRVDVSRCITGRTKSRFCMIILAEWW